MGDKDWERIKLKSTLQTHLKFLIFVSAMKLSNSMQV